MHVSILVNGRCAFRPFISSKTLRTAARPHVFDNTATVTRHKCAVATRSNSTYAPQRNKQMDKCMYKPALRLSPQGETGGCIMLLFRGTELSSSDLCHLYLERLKAGYISCVRRGNECACRCAHVQVGIHTCAHKRTHTSCMRMPAISARSNVEAPFDCPSERRQGVGAVSIARLVTTSAFYVPSKSNVVCISCSAAGAACCHEQFAAGEAVRIARVVEVVVCLFFSLSIVPMRNANVHHL